MKQIIRKWLAAWLSNPYAVMTSMLLLITFTSAYRINQIYLHTEQLEHSVRIMSDQQKILTAQISAQPSKTQPQPTAATATTPAQDAINDIFMSPPLDSDAQAKLDVVKKRYEEILVTFMYLQHCKLNKPEDYHIINSAFAQELSSLNAPARLQYDTLTAAKGSYEGVYAKTSCTQPKDSKLVEQYNAFIQGVSARFGLAVP